jgi:hypothetical protein
MADATIANSSHFFLDKSRSSVPSKYLKIFFTPSEWHFGGAALCLLLNSFKILVFLLGYVFLFFFA